MGVCRCSGSGELSKSLVKQRGRGRTRTIWKGGVSAVTDFGAWPHTEHTISLSMECQGCALGGGTGHLAGCLPLVGVCARARVLGYTCTTWGLQAYLGWGDGLWDGSRVMCGLRTNGCPCFYPAAPRDSLTVPSQVSLKRRLLRQVSQ